MNCLRIRPAPVVVLAIVLWFPAAANGQQRQLTTADRVAALYAPQLDFTARDTPMVRVGLLEGRDDIQFTPSEAIHVMPRGDRGAAVKLPADEQYTVTISDGEAGSYKHWVVVEELTAKQHGKVDTHKKKWKKRGYAAKTFQVGGLFGIQGNVFDSRKILVAVGGVDTYDRAETLRDKLIGRYGIEGRIHSQLTEYPSGRFKLTGDEVETTVKHRDVLWIGPADGETDDIAYEVPDVPEGRGDATATRRYGGQLIIAPDRNGSIALINKIGTERLLEGVVPSEIYSTAPKAALRAQAVAARNTIFSAIGARNLADPYMLRSDIYDQVYKGLDAHAKRTSKAIEATRGEVLFHGKQIIEAVYSANAGGFTENNENVWNAEALPYLRGQPDAPDGSLPKKFRDGIDKGELSSFLDANFDTYAAEASMGRTNLYRWRTTVDAGEVLKWLRQHDRALKGIAGASVSRRGVSGRAIRVKFEGVGGKTVEVRRELNIRRAFGGLKSALFSMSVQRDSDGSVDEFSFRGAGFGHGVGMCQTGAIGMAEQNHSHSEILDHYYTDVELRELY